MELVAYEKYSVTFLVIFDQNSRILETFIIEKAWNAQFGCGLISVIVIMTSETTSKRNYVRSQK